MDIEGILLTASEQGASDIHLVCGEPPVIRVDTGLIRLDHPVLEDKELREQLKVMLNEQQQFTLEEHQDVDLSWATESCRYRVNVHFQRGVPAIAMRTVKTKIPPLDSLNLPPAIAPLAELPRGLVLVTGDTGSGKSTTLASLLQQINTTKSRHIITLEDPVEFASAMSSSTKPLKTSVAIEASRVTIPLRLFVSITFGISNVRDSRIMFCTAGSQSKISTAGTIPPPIFGSKVCEITAFNVLASIERTWDC